MSRPRDLTSGRTIRRLRAAGPRHIARLLALSLAFAAAPLGAERVLGPGGGGEIGGNFEERARVGTGAERVDPDRRLRYWLKLPLAGRIGNGHGIGYTFTLRPSTMFSRGRAADPDVRVRQLDYDAGFRVSGIPATTLAASFARGRARGARGGAPLSETDVSSRSVAMTVGFRPLPLNAAVLERISDQAWTILPQVPALRQAERTRTWRVAGQNSRTAVHIDRTDHDDRSFGFDYDAWSAGFAHTLPWGKGSRLQSTFERAERDGSSPIHQRTFEERLHLQHARPFSTDWDYARHDSRGAANLMRTESYGLALEHRPRPWLDWGAAARSYTTRAPAFDTRAIDTRAHLGVERRWRGGLRTRANGDLGVEHRTDRAPGGVTLAVVGERHVVNTSRAFLLDLPNPDISSVVIRGIGPPTVFVRDLDFGLAPAGDRIEVRLTPASRIGVGEVLDVDYRYVAVSRPAGRATTARYQLAAEYGVVALRHGGSTRDSDLEVMGMAANVPDEREARTEIEARWAAGRGFLGVRGRHETRLSPRFDQRASEAQAEWTSPWGAGVRTSLIGGWSRRSGDGGRLDVVSGDARADWNARPWLRLGALIQAYALTRADSRNEGRVDGSLDAQLRVAAIDVSLRYRQQWARAQSPGAMRVVSVQMVRRF